jgi:hypothetical protein
VSNSYTTVFTAPAPPDHLLQAFLIGFDGTDATITLSGVNNIVITRRYIPTWAIVVGIIGLLFFLLGVFAFLIKETEVLTVALSPEDEGRRTRVAISGVAGATVAARVNHIVAHYKGLPAAPSS